MLRIEFLVQNSKQILNVRVKTQLHVTDLKGPVNKGFNQFSFVARRCKAQEISNHTCEGPLAVYGGAREV